MNNNVTLFCVKSLPQESTMIQKDESAHRYKKKPQSIVNNDNYPLYFSFFLLLLLFFCLFDILRL